MTRQIRVFGIPAAARVHGRNQLEARLIADMHLGARQRHRAGFNRLAQRVGRLTGKFRQLIQKQHTIMRQRNLAWAGVTPTTNQRGHTCRMMRGAKRALMREPHPPRWVPKLSIRLISRRSRGVRLNKIPGRREASTDLPAPSARLLTDYDHLPRQPPAPCGFRPDREYRPYPARLPLAAQGPLRAG